MNGKHRARVRNIKRHLALGLAAALGMTGTMVALAWPAGAEVISTSAGCVQGWTLNDHWPLKTSGADTVRPVNSLTPKSNWGPTPGLQYDGTSVRGIGGMLYGFTNIDIGTRDFVVTAKIRTTDGLYNGPLQFDNSPGGGPSNVGFFKLTGQYFRIVGTTGDVKLDVTQDLNGDGDPDSMSDGAVHALCAQRVNGVLSFYVDGRLQQRSSVNVGSVNLAGLPLQMVGKYQPGLGYHTSDMLGVYGPDWPANPCCLHNTWGNQYDIQLATRAP